MCQDLFSEEAPFGSILVNDHLLLLRQLRLCILGGCLREVQLYFDLLKFLLGSKRVLNKVLYGEAPPWSPKPYAFIRHFDRKGISFLIPSIEKWYLFHVPTLDILELCIRFNAVIGL